MSQYASVSVGHVVGHRASGPVDLVVIYEYVTSSYRSHCDQEDISVEEPF